MRNPRVGDIIEIINREEHYSSLNNGITGVIKYIDSIDEPRFAIEFDKYDKELFHSCGNKCKNGHGFWIKESEIKVIDYKLFKVGDLIIQTSKQCINYKCVGKVKEIDTKIKGKTYYEIDWLIQSKYCKGMDYDMEITRWLEDELELLPNKPVIKND